ncbi:MAG TPA: vanadium-dependent haloperoxidase [Chitinophagaceae bacterium]
MTTSFKMNRHSIASLFIATIVSSIVMTSCQKANDQIADNSINQRGKPTAYSSDVLDKWMTMQLRLMRNATGIPNHGFSRPFGYAGIAAFEALKPAMSNQTAQWSNKWNGLPDLSTNYPVKRFYLPQNVNAAMAAINKAMFPNASAADKAAIDSLELALKNEFLVSESAEVIATSTQYGQEIASSVFSWADADGYKDANAPYTIPVGTGLWKPTPPSFANPATPYWGNNRTMVKGSINNCQVDFSVNYSTEPSSAFYQSVKEVHDASLLLTDDQKTMANFWKDVPGVSSPGHWLSILQQVIKQTGTGLEKAALAYALTGAACNDALIVCFKDKYRNNVVRPVTYIREVMGQSTWNSFIGTPAHPEFPSAHSSLSGASAFVLENLFNGVGSFTDHTYDYLNYGPRTYSSFYAIAEEAGLSRFYAGIHYKMSISSGLYQGYKVTSNIFSKTSVLDQVKQSK